MRLATLIVLIVLIVCVGSSDARADVSKLGKEQVEPGARGFARGVNKLCCGYPLSEERGFKYTFYWMADQSRHDDATRWQTLPDDVLDFQGVGLLRGHEDVYTREGFLLGSFARSFVKELKMEGSGWLADGRVVNYAGRCRYGVGTCFEVMNPETHPFGRGAHRRPLVPFRSVAVDRRLIPIGDTLYVPEFDGMPLPDGGFHDGCLRADDTGGAIKKRLIDFFVADMENFMWVNQHMWFDRYFTPHIEDPRCDYLRDER
jgi:3D (Asp-Asp-Asp) domain-containing protein